MALVINTNVASLNAQRNLDASQSAASTSLERLSSGLRINSARDDAAGLAIANRFTSQINGLNQAARNAADGISLAQTAEGALQEVTNNLQRIRELAVQAQSGTNSDSDIDNLQLEANALIDEIGRVSEDTTYNNTAYLGSGASTSINIQVGYNDGDTITLQTYNVKAENLGVKVADVSGSAGDTVLVALKNADGTYLQIDQTATAADGTTTDRVPGALEVITTAIDQVASYKAEWGAGQNRLEYTVSNLMNVVEFTTAAQSRIQDADFAVEAARLAKAQVLQQTGTAMLAQANAAPQIALQLLK